jgi:hypothetical protein
MDNMGIVIKFKGKNAVVITEDGTFEVIKKREGMFTGQKILYRQGDVVSTNMLPVKYYYPAIASIAAVLILMFSFYRFFLMEGVYAYIDVDINPSIELSVDKNGNVKSLMPMNEEAKIVVNDIQYKDLCLDDVLLNIIDESIDYGFIDEKSSENLILVSAAITGKGNKKDAKNEEHLDKIINDVKNTVNMSNENISLQYIKVPSEYRQKASDNKISMGKYMVFEKAREKGAYIEIEELRDNRLYDLVTKSGIELEGNSKDLTNASPTIEITQSPSVKGSSDLATPRASVLLYCTKPRVRGEGG